MAKWEYNVVVSHVALPGPSGISAMGAVYGAGAAANINVVWDIKGPDGLSNWDRIQMLGAEGWEMVSCFPVAVNQGVTFQVVWVFKRQLPGS